MILKSSVLFVLSCVFIFIQETSGKSSFGTPGVDYPDYKEIPPTSFRCVDQVKGIGFYPDFETRCQVFHYCGENTHETFICPIGTTYNERIQSCDHWFNTECRAPKTYKDEIVYDSRPAYTVAEDGSEVYQLSGSLYDKMTSLYERNPSEAYENGQIGYESGGQSEYGSSSYGMGSQYDPRVDEEELASEIASGGVYSPLQYDRRENDGLFNYESTGEGVNEDVYDGSIPAHEAILENMNQAPDGESTSDFNSGFNQRTEDTDPSFRSHPSQGLLYYPQPALYNYDTRAEDGSDVTYGGETDSEGVVYGKNTEYDDNEEDEGGDYGEGTVLQKRISEYRKRPRPKPVVSYVESDVEIVTLPPPKAKSSRIPLVVEHLEQPESEPMVTTTTESVIEDLRASEPEELADQSFEDPRSNIEEESNQTSSSLQSFEKEDEDGFGERVTDDLSGDNETHYSEQPDSSKFSNDDEENNRDDLEQTGSSTPQSMVEDLYNKMSPNLFYVDSNNAYQYGGESTSDDPFNDDAFVDENYNGNYGIDANEYGGIPFNVIEEDQPENYDADVQNSEIADTSDASTNESTDFKTAEYDSENKEIEDEVEVFQEVVDQNGKIYFKFGDKIIDPAEHIPGWNEESFRMEEMMYGDDSEELNEADGNSPLDNSIETDNESQISVSYSGEPGQNFETVSETSEGNYFHDDLKEMSYGQDAEDSASDSVYDSAETSSEMYYPNPEVYASTQGYDAIDIEGVYDGSEEAEDGVFSDSEYDNVPLYTNPVYFEGDVNAEKEERVGEGTDVMVSEDIDTSSVPSGYHFDTDDIGERFVSDQPYIGVPSSAILEEYASDAYDQGEAVFPFERQQFESDTELPEFFQHANTYFPDADDVSEETSATEAIESEQVSESNLGQSYEPIFGRSDDSETSKIQADSSIEQENNTDSEEDAEFPFEMNQSDVEFQGFFQPDYIHFPEVDAVSEQKTSAADVTEMKQAIDQESDHNSDWKSKDDSDFSELDAVSEQGLPALGAIESEKVLKPISGHSSEPVFKVLADSKSSPIQINSSTEQGTSTAHETKIIKDWEQKLKENRTGAGPFLKLLNLLDIKVEPPSTVEKIVDSKSNFQRSSSWEPTSSDSGVTNEPQHKEPSARSGRKLKGNSKVGKLLKFVTKMFGKKKKAKSNLLRKIIPTTNWDDYEVKPDFGV